MTHTFLCSSIILCLQVKFAFHFIKTQMLQMGKGGGCPFTFYQLLKIKFYIGWNKRQTVTLCADGKNHNYCQMKFEFKQIIT